MGMFYKSNYQKKENGVWSLDEYERFMNSAPNLDSILSINYMKLDNVHLMTFKDEMANDDKIFYSVFKGENFTHENFAEMLADVIARYANYLAEKNENDETDEWNWLKEGQNVVCIKPYEGFTIGKTYKVDNILEKKVPGHIYCTITDDDGDTRYVYVSLTDPDCQYFFFPLS